MFLFILLNNALLLNRRDSSVLGLGPLGSMLAYLVRVGVLILSVLLEMLEQGSYTSLSFRKGGQGLLQ